MTYLGGKISYHYRFIFGKWKEIRILKLESRFSFQMEEKNTFLSLSFSRCHIHAKSRGN